jgi:hypothetical protein
VTEIPAARLQELQGALDREQWDVAAEVLHELGKFPAPRMVRPDGARERWVNLWDHLDLARLPDGLRIAFRRKFDPEAAIAFDRAWEERNLPECSDLAERYALASGFSERISRLMDAALSRGEYATAVRLGSWLLRSRPPELWKPEWSGRLALALSRADLAEVLELLREHIGARADPEAWIWAGEERMLLGDFIGRLGKEPPDRTSDLDLDLRPESTVPQKSNPWGTIRVFRDPSGTMGVAFRSMPGVSTNWSTRLCRMDRPQGLPGALAWIRGGMIYVLAEGRALGAIERMTGRVSWVRGLEGVLGGLEGPRLRLP